MAYTPKDNGRRGNGLGGLEPAKKRVRPIKDGSDRGGYPPDQTTRRYSGATKGGIWTNNNGTEVGRSNTEDSTVTAGKSTGDRAPLYDAFIAQRRKAKTKGY